MKYEHLHRLENHDLPALPALRQVFNHVRPHETLNGRRPIQVYHDPSLHPQPSDRAS